MPLLVVCRTSITHGKASEAPASASVPIRPRKKPSKVMTPTKARRLRTFGAASRNSVGRTGPSSRSFVRAAGDGGGILADAGGPEGADALCWVMGAGPERGIGAAPGSVPKLRRSRYFARRGGPQRMKPAARLRFSHELWRGRLPPPPCGEVQLGRRPSGVGVAGHRALGRCRPRPVSAAGPRPGVRFGPAPSADTG